MKGHLSHDSLVEVPAAVLWDVYRGLRLGKLLNQLLRDVIGTVEVVYGDGGVGTILKFTFPPGTPGPSYMKEVFTRIDDEQRLKEGKIFEGGLKDAGFKVYRQSLQIIEKDAQSSVIRSTVEYEIDDELHELASLATTKPMERLNEAVGKYLKQNWDSSDNQYVEETKKPSQGSLVEASAPVIWQTCRGLVLGKLVGQLLRDVIGTVEVVHGDRGAGTMF